MKCNEQLRNLMLSVSDSIVNIEANNQKKTDLVKRNEYGYKCMLAAVKQALDYMEALNACLHNRWSRQSWTFSRQCYGISPLFASSDRNSGDSCHLFWGCLNCS